MRYFRFRFGGEIAFRANEPPDEIDLDLIKKLLKDRDAIGRWQHDDAVEIDDEEMAATVKDLGGDPRDYVQGRLPGFM